MSKLQKQQFLKQRKVLKEKGYEKARLADVARSAITPAALYKHFANRDALFTEMIKIG